jgi:DNA-binding response OmpR family regulator
MPGEKILIVDDDSAMNDLVRKYIEKEGYAPLQALNGKDALRIVKDLRPDLIILDIMLPDIDGTNLCLEIRKITDVPIIFLSNMNQEIDKIVALSVGGDDYMTKPFSPGEFVARIKAHLRRDQMRRLVTNDDFQEVYTFPDLTVNMLTYEVFSDGRSVNLTPKEFEVLSLFIKNPKRIFSADQLFELAWKTNSIDGDAKTAMVHVSTLRKKIEPNPKTPKYIISIRGFGYKFNHHLME